MITFMLSSTKKIIGISNYYQHYLHFYGIINAYETFQHLSSLL